MSQTKSAMGACELGAKGNIKSVNYQPESGRAQSGLLTQFDSADLSRDGFGQAFPELDFPWVFIRRRRFF